MMAKKIRAKDLARKLGLSPATVSLAYNNPKVINRETRRRILELGNELGFVRRKYTKGRSKNIGVIGENFYIPLGGFYNFVTVGILKAAKKFGLNAIVGSCQEDEEALPSMITRGLIDGLIVVGRFPSDNLLRIKQENIPLVLCGNPTPGVELHTVVPDGRGGISQVTRQLIGLGHKKIAMVTGGPAFDPVSSDRVDGYRFALAEAGIKLAEDYIASADFYKLETVVPAVNKLLSLDRPPTAIVCACDAIAYTAIKALKEKGRRVPADISVVGFDDIPFPDFIEINKPQLTTAHVDLERLGEVAVEVLLEVIENPVKAAYRHTLPTRLIVRETTAPLAGSK